VPDAFYDVVGELFWDTDERGYALIFKLFVCAYLRPILTSPTRSFIGSSQEFFAGC
jgi:hypothetical protein